MDQTVTHSSLSPPLLLHRLSVPVPPPEVLAGALLEVPTHLGNLGYQVWEKMQPMVTYSKWSIWTQERSPSMNHYVCMEMMYYRG